MEFELIIPKGWDCLPLKELTTKIGSGATPNGGGNSYKSAGTALVRSMNVYDDGFKKDGLAFIDDLQANKLSNVILQSKDVLLNITGASIARCCIVPEFALPGRVNQHVSILRTNERKILPEFLHLFLISPKQKNRLMNISGGGATREALTKKMIEGIEIPLPPLPEQARIVAKLDALFERIDQAIGLLEKNIRQMGELGKAILNDAVSGKLIAQNTNDEQAQSFIEKLQKAIKSRYPKSTFEKVAKQEFELPKGWTTIRLADYTLINTGATPLTTKKEYYEGEIAWVTSSATNAPFVTKAEKFISEKALAETNCKIFPKNTLLVALYGQGKTRGQITELLIEAATNQACAAIEFYTDHSFFKDFIKLFFQNNYEAIRSLSDGGTQANLNLSKIKNTIIPIPPYEEQRRIVTKYKTLSEKLEKMNSFNLQKLQSLKSLKSSLLDQAFRGEL